MMNSLSGFFSGFYRINDGLITFNNIASGKDRRVVGLIIMRVDNIMLRFYLRKGIQSRVLPHGQIYFPLPASVLLSGVHGGRSLYFR